MFSRAMIASLVLVSISSLLCASEFHDKKNYLSARFPGTVKTIHPNTRISRGPCTLYRAPFFIFSSREGA